MLNGPPNVNPGRDRERKRVGEELAEPMPDDPDWLQAADTARQRREQAQHLSEIGEREIKKLWANSEQWEKRLWVAEQTLTYLVCWIRMLAGEERDWG